jgi:hypothetical protein
MQRMSVHFSNTRQEDGCRPVLSDSLIMKSRTDESARYNERLRLDERRLPFDIRELKKAAAKSVDRSTSDIMRVHKLAEGGFNRILEVTFKDGFSIVARLPYPHTQPKRLAVASEVATLEYVRERGIPVPKVFGYEINENPVGIEYMLMEKMLGKPLGAAWLDCNVMSAEQRLRVLDDIIKIEAKLFEMFLPASGSIYYTRDLPADARVVKIPESEGRLCIGPYASYKWWQRGRSELDVDRGPREYS